MNVDYDSMEFQFTTPREYARELAKAIGRYATLGMAEDTNALNDGVLSDDAFITLCDSFISADTFLLICSDHGFASFRREVHLNSWLVALTSLYLNVKGREGKGILEAGEISQRRTEVFPPCFRSNRAN